MSVFKLMVLVVPLMGFGSYPFRVNRNDRCCMAPADRPNQTFPRKSLRSISHSWVVQTSVGVQSFYGDHSGLMRFQDRWTPSLTFGVGRWFSGKWGVQAASSGWSVNGLTRDGNYAVNVPYGEASDLERQRVRYHHVGMEVMYNLAGRDKIRVASYSPARNAKASWLVVPFAGIGLLFGTDRPTRTLPSASAGMWLSYRMAKDFDIVAVGRGIATVDDFDGDLGGSNYEGILSLTVGAVYHFRWY